MGLVNEEEAAEPKAIIEDDEWGHCWISEEAIRKQGVQASGLRTCLVSIFFCREREKEKRARAIEQSITLFELLLLSVSGGSGFFPLDSDSHVCSGWRPGYDVVDYGIKLSWNNPLYTFEVLLKDKILF